MKKTVNFCGNCPFMYSEYDDFAVDDSTTEICTLAQYLSKQNYIISTQNGTDVYEQDDSPEWCPLKEEDFEFSYKRYSKTRLKEISVLKDKIINLSNEVDNDDTINVDDPRYNELNSLNVELDNLYNNEDITIEDFSDELNKHVMEMNEQMNNILNETNKLNNIVNNLTNEEDSDKNRKTE